MDKENEFYIEKHEKLYENLGIEIFMQNTPKNTVSTNSHIHSSVEILYVTEGSFVFYVDGVRCDIKSGDILLCRSNTIHKGSSGEQENNSYYVLKIHPSFIFDISGKSNAASYALALALNSKDSKCVFRSDEEITQNISSLILSLAHEMNGKTPCYDIAVRANAAQIVMLILRYERELNPDYAKKGDSIKNLGNFYELIKYINKNYSENISAYSLAKKMNMSYSHFSRMFSSLTGQNVREYLNIVRLNRSEKLLLTTDKTVTEIAFECGYGTTSYFVMLFRKQKGMTPGECRLRHSQNSLNI